MHKRLLFTLALTLALSTLPGCNLVYKQNIQQGNAIQQEDLDKLRLGMSMNQVYFLLGTPAIQDPFHHDRWDYVSSFSRRGGDPLMRKVTLFFENGVLAEMVGVEGDEFIFEDEPEAGADTDSGEAATAATVPADAGPEISPLQSPSEQTSDLGAADGAWSIQFGVFDDLESAEREAERLRNAGFAAEVSSQVEAEAGQRYSVRQPGVASEEAANALIDEIRGRLGINGFVVPPEG